MLTGSEILKRIQKGDIYISDFDKSRINPNSYNLTLSNKLKVYDDVTNIYQSIDHPCVTTDQLHHKYLDMKKDNPTTNIIIPEDGIILEPGVLYLGSTNEKTACDTLIPCIDGRSSIGRLGINVHATAGFGDVGFHGTWTLEITVVHPIKIYPNCEICQIYFYEPVGDCSITYHGKYQYQDSPVESQIFKEYENGRDNND